MITDSNVEEVRRVREELIKRHGGLDGYMRHLQTVERKQIRKTKKKPTGRTGARALKNGRRERRMPAERVKV